MKIYSNQSILCLLIQYYSSGNFSTFKKICNIAYPDSYALDYFYANFLQACNISGLIDVLDCDGAFKWSSALDGNMPYIRIDSSYTKLIGTKLSWFEEYSSDVTAVISSQMHGPLIYSLNSTSKITTNKTFDNLICNMLSDLPKIERRVCHEEKNQLYSNVKFECFNIDSFTWTQTHVSVQDLKQPLLYRIHKDFSGPHYYICYPEFNINFNIRYPEWVYIIACRQFKWSLNEIVDYKDGTLRIDGRFRLPTLVLRYLFANSNTLNIGKDLVFSHIDKKCVDILLSCLNASVVKPL